MLLTKSERRVDRIVDGVNRGQSVSGRKRTLWFSAATGVSNSASTYLGPGGSSTSADVGWVMPAGGIITGIYVVGDVGPGTGGDNFGVAARLDAGSTSVSVTLTDTQTSAFLDGERVSFTAGQTIAVRTNPGSSPANSPRYRGYVSIILEV